MRQHAFGCYCLLIVTGYFLFVFQVINNKLNFILKKDDLEINSIKIYDNSNYILKTF